MLMGKPGDCGNVGHGQKRVCRAFDQDGFYIGRQLFRESGQVGGVDNFIGNAEVFKNLVQHPEGSAVDIAGQKQLIPLLKKAQHRGNGRHAGGKGQTVGAFLQIGQELFKGRAGGVARSGVFPDRGFPQPRLPIGRGLINRNIDGPGCGVPVNSTVD